MRRGRSFAYEVGEDEAAAITFRYMRAGVEGAARRNLRLLASVAAGQAANEGLFADDFLKWADILAGVGRSELILLGPVQRIAIASSFDPDDAAAFWDQVLEVLAKEQKVGTKEAETAAAACLRTGLLRMVSGHWGRGNVYTPSNTFQEFSRLSVFETVLRAEGDI
jgi:hypothetical protein